MIKVPAVCNAMIETRAPSCHPMQPLVHMPGNQTKDSDIYSSPTMNKEPSPGYEQYHK